MIMRLKINFTKRIMRGCRTIGLYGMWLIFLLISFPVFAQQNVEVSRRDTIRYGTDTEIAALIQSLRTEKADYLDEELSSLALTSRNQSILTGIFGFFGEREKSGLEQRAINAVTDRFSETNETVIAALEYLGNLKFHESVPAIMELLDTEERRFYYAGFRVIGKASSGNAQLADETAEFLINFYDNRNPGNENQSNIITAIGDTGSSAGVQFLANIVTNIDERLTLRIAALGALSKIGDEDGLEAILSCITTNDPNVRSAAVAALGPFSGAAVDSAILDAFRDSYYRSRIAAAQASGVRRLEAAVPYLRYRAERDDVPGVKDEAIRALGTIAGAQAIEVLESLFFTRTNPERVRLLSSEMLMRNSADVFFTRIAAELDEAKSRNQTNLYNGILKVVGEAAVQGDKAEVQRVAHNFMRNGAIIEKLYGLDMAANNGLSALREEIIILSRDRNETIKQRAIRTAERLGITIPNE